jgi:transposase InsO family protein
MQIKRLHKNIYKLYAYSRTQICLDVYRKKYEEKVCRWKKLTSEGISFKTAQEILGFSRSTFYKMKKTLKDLEKGMSPPSKRPKRVNKPRWGEAQKQFVLQIRRVNPTYGKEKIAVILKRDHGQTISESTVGRILCHLKAKGLIIKSASALRTKRRRAFKDHAKPWTYKEYKAMVIGERVQIDHMTVTKNGLAFKHFQAWDRRSKFINTALFSNAKSSSAKRFLLDFVRLAPYPILSIQVDSGSEFMAEFEDCCCELGIPLIVLPPSKPTYNGGVERGNRTFREEFYDRKDLLADSIGAMRFELNKATEKYNTYRPHLCIERTHPYGVY